MSCTFQPEKTCVGLDNTWLMSGNTSTLKHAYSQKGLVEIGKLNIFLIGLIVVILFALIAQDEDSTLFSPQSVRLQTVTIPEIAAIETQAAHEISDDVSSEVEPVEMPEPALQSQAKNHKKHSKNIAVAASRNTQTTQQIDGQTSHTEPIAETKTDLESDHTNLKEPSRDILIFNIWSVSELRLRSVYTKLINDSSAPSVIAEARKKEYLNFANKRTHKCGELNNKFASNINTVEKLSFKEKDVDILECHTSENTTEINRLNDLGLNIS